MDENSDGDDDSCSSLRHWLASDNSDTPSILVLDGGVSTHLEHLIHPKCFPHRELWSSSLLLSQEGQVYIQQGHADWLHAGADILSTVTYQCHFGTGENDAVVYNPPVVKDDLQMKEIMAQGVRLAQKTVQEFVSKSGRSRQSENHHHHHHQKAKFVVASSGCYGAALADGSEYTGSYPSYMKNRNKLMDFHFAKAAVLVEAQPDGLAVETIPSLEECRAVIQMLGRLPEREQQGSNQNHQNKRVAYWISLACQNESQLNDGHSVIDALDALREMDPDAEVVHAVGINCCNPLHVPSLLRIIVGHMATQGPRRGIVVYPNSGEEWDAEKADWKEGTGVQSSDEFTQQMVEAIHLIRAVWKQHLDKTTASRGSNITIETSCPKIIVGGCCRTSPQTISKIRAAVDELNKN